VRKIDFYIQEAFENIKSDRAATNSILVDAMIYLKKNEEHHKNVGIVVAKYLETLQRSNEQLVKIAAIAEKVQRTSYDQELTDYDKDDIFEEINEIEEEMKDGK